ncbi:hypothetical protein [Azospirillum soli]|uniref:hypothetical protein n=1 Tax=Azospirillum soli TaxID=1304799 RepID=UPI001AE2BED8|nr:hypothetical protein [Azospirillum soli]MBP2316964.1 glutamate/tyrosine decarboxylase-like PLP-dependent enzyme [Azospirillum soli]
MVTKPTESPSVAYASCAVSGIDDALFALKPEGLSDVERQSALTQLSLYEVTQKSRFLGYQANQYDNYGELSQYMTMHLNNIGDPFVTGNFTINTKFMERPVLDYYAALWNAKWPHESNDLESYWGYVLTMGSTEGNLYGLWNARDYLAGKVLLDDPETAAKAVTAPANSLPRKLVWHQADCPHDNPNAYTPVAFYSEDTHYSIIKIMRILNVSTFYELGTNQYPGQCPITKDGQWPQEVPSVGGALGPGCIDVDALEKLVEFFASRGYPIMVCCNYGTTFKGAYDDVEAVGKRLLPMLKKYGLDEREVVYDPAQGLSDRRTGYWIQMAGTVRNSVYGP